MKNCLHVFLFLLIANIGFSQGTLLVQESFEGDASNYDANTFDDGANDYFMVLSNSSTKVTGGNWPKLLSSVNGTNFFGAEDVGLGKNDNYATIDGGYIVIGSQDVSAYDKVTVKVAFAEAHSSGVDSDETDKLLVQYAFDNNIATAGDANVNTGTYTTIGAFYANGDAASFQEDSNLDGTVDGQVLDTVLRDFSYSFSTGGASNVSVRIVFDVDGYEETAVDNIRVYGENSSSTAYSGGTGSSTDPYIIEDLDDLKKLSETPDDWDKYFVQTADIDASETRNWNVENGDTLGFSPIGYLKSWTDYAYFNGSYNGKGHTISGLYINRPSSENIGLFGICNGSIDSLGLEDANVTGNKYVGSMVGQFWGVDSISNCYSTGTVNGYTGVCDHTSAGGLLGFTETSTSSGKIGIVNCYSKCSVNGYCRVGGLVGNNTCNIKNCYSVGSVNGNSDTGGLIGKNYSGTITNCFCDTTTSNQSSSGGGTGLSTTEMKTVSTFSTWNTDIWVLKNGSYPYLKWQDGASSGPFSGGTGTEADPFQIANLNDLKMLSDSSQYWDSCFVQTADIDATLTDTMNVSGNDTLGFSPIGNITDNFTGSYNGKGHTVSNLYINLPTTDYIGMFGSVTGGKICNLGVKNSVISGKQCVGALAGKIEDGAIIDSCYSSGSLKSTYIQCGGLVGFAAGSDAMGECTIKNSYSTATVVTTNRAGGFIGHCGCIVINCYATGNAGASVDYAGGFAGFAGGYSEISNCYSKCSVDCPGGNVNGFVGYCCETAGGPVITNCFWDVGASGIYGEKSGDGNGGATGKSTAEMKNLCTYSGAGWGFPNEWTMGEDNGGYPALAWQGYVHTAICAPFSGSGTKTAPYIIATLEDLDSLSSNSSYWDKHFIQTADLEFTSADFESGGEFYNNGKGFSPIGNSTTNFTGSYNGKGHTISNLYISLLNIATDYVGLFGYSSCSVIDSVGLVDCDIAGEEYTGALIGYADQDTIRSCYSTGTVDGYMYVGGLVGYCYNNGIVHSCHTIATVTASYYYCGGLVAYSKNKCVISNCYSTGTVTSKSDFTGGLVGYLSDNSTISSCFSTATVKSAGGWNHTGGLCGHSLSSSTIKDCYSTGDVSGTYFVGGLVGKSSGDSVSCCYSTGKVTADGMWYGALLGDNSAVVDSCYFNAETSGQSYGIGNKSNTSDLTVTGYTTAQMKTASNFTNAGWDIVSGNDESYVWNIESNKNEGYPYLSWQTLEASSTLNLTARDTTIYLDSDGQAYVIAPNVITSATGGTDTTLTVIDDAPKSASIVSPGTDPDPEPNPVYDTLFFDCEDVGDIEIEVKLSGEGDIFVADTVTVTVADTTPPSLTVQNDTVYLNRNSSASVTANALTKSTDDNCTFDRVEIAKAQGNKSANITNPGCSFGCDDIGDNKIIVTAYDGSGNKTVDTAIVTVLDTVSPEFDIVTNPDDLTIYFDSTGVAVMEKGMFVYNVWDNCSVKDTLLSKDTCKFEDYYNAGMTSMEALEEFSDIEATVLDGSGNSTAKSTYFYPIDTIKPWMGVQGTTVCLGDKGTATVSVAQLTVSANDNCMVKDTTIRAISTDKSATIATGANPSNSKTCQFGCEQTGTNYIEITLTDASSNTTLDTVEVIVEDNIAPLLETKDSITVYLSASGGATVIPAQLVISAGDACGIKDTLVSIVGAQGQTPGVLCSFDCENVGAENKIAVKLTDNNDNVTLDTVTVTVVDNIYPMLGTKDSMAVYLSASGEASLYAAQLVTSAADNCPAIDTAISIVNVYKSAKPALPETPKKSCSFDCGAVGENLVEVKLEDASGNVTVDTAIVTVLDTVAPVLVAKESMALPLGASGTAFVTAAQLVTSASDACGLRDTLISTGGGLPGDTCYFYCGDVGEENKITVKLTDNNGNVASGTVTVTVEDNILPELTAQGDTVYIDGKSSATVTVAQLVLSAGDNCSVSDTTVRAISINKSALPLAGQKTCEYSCGQTGTNYVEVTLADASGNIALDTVEVTVLDTTPPSLAVQNVTVYLGTGASASITAKDLTKNASDNCSVDRVEIGKAAKEKSANIVNPGCTFGCGDIGDNKVTVAAYDPSGNVTLDTAIVTVLDTVAPVLVAKESMALPLGASGTAFVTAAQLVTSASDACGLRDTLISTGGGLPGDTCYFYCGDVGEENKITVKLTDNNGNVASGTVTVTVEDNILPELTAQGDTVYIDGKSSATVTVAQLVLSAGDNCSVSDTTVRAISINKSALPLAGQKTCEYSCGQTGTNYVEVTLADASGNIALDTVGVTVLDTTPPSLAVQNVTVYLGTGASASITAKDLTKNASDNCSVDRIEIGKAAKEKSANIVNPGCTFGCGDIGDNKVTVAAYDPSGNVTLDTAIVTVLDTALPVLETIGGTTVYLDSLGSATITARQLVSYASDNCPPDTAISIAGGSMAAGTAPLQFNYLDIGANSVEVRLSDPSGNTVLDTVEVTVRDTIMPMLKVRGADVYLDSYGGAEVSATDLVTYKWDNCPIASETLSASTFGCGDIGGNNVTVAIKDWDGNEIKRSVEVTVHDVAGPVFEGNAIEAYLDSTGSYELTGGDILAMFGNISDNCSGIDEMSLGAAPRSFTCEGLGTAGGTAVQLAAADANGNESQGSATVTVLDSLAPWILPVADIEIGVEAGTGATGIDYPEITYGDNCGASLTLVSGLGRDGLFPVGTTTEAWVAADASGNTDTVSFRVEVKSAQALASLSIVATVGGDIIAPGSISYSFYKEESGGGFLPAPYSSYTANGDTATVGLEPGNWLVLGSPVESPATFVATYPGGATHWENAPAITLGENETALLPLECAAAGEAGGGTYSISGYVYRDSTATEKSCIVKTEADSVKTPMEGALAKLFKDGGASPLMTDLTDGEGLYSFKGLAAGTYYVEIDIPGLYQSGEYALALGEGNPEGSLSFVANYGTNAITDDEVLETGSGILMYPNPAGGEVSIEIGKVAGKIRLSVTGMGGKLEIVREYAATDRITIDMSGKTPGMYMVVLDIDGVREVKKLIVKR